MRNSKLWLTLVVTLALMASSALAAPVPGGSLNPTTIPKYLTPLVIPPAMPKSTSPDPTFLGNYYEIAVRQFQQNILPTSMGLPTTVWSYCSKTDVAGTLNYPAFTIEATYNTPVRIKWINELVDGAGDFLPHILPVDPTLHWANPPAGSDPSQYGFGKKDSRPTFIATPGRYTGPVPIVTHVHGAHVNDDSDGYAEAWTLPAANNIPAGYATTGTWYDFFKPRAEARFAGTGAWTPGSMVFQYPNDQRATTMWYHDHTLGMTRLNVYAGPAGFYILRGGPDGDDNVKNQNTGQPAVLPSGNFEIPIVIQDRSFNADGSLFFPDNRAFFEGLNVPGLIPQQFPGAGELQIPFIGAQACTGQSDIAPFFNPESFGNTMVVNGKTWPNQQVEPKRYRLRFLNGCNSRVLILRLITAKKIDKPGTWKQVPQAFAQIGSEGGFLPQTVVQNDLLVGLAERADVILDFSAFPAGSFVYLINVGPDSPFGGGVPGKDFPVADPGTTGQVMRFEIVPGVGADTTTPPGLLQLPFTPITAPVTNTLKVSLNELDSFTVKVSTNKKTGNILLDCANPSALPFGPMEAKLGVMDAAGNGVPKAWMDAITENPALASTVQWEIYNFTADAHPIHIHEVMFQVVDRQNLAVDKFGMTLQPAVPVGAPFPPNAWETGYKDTVLAYPGQVTRLKATFDRVGLYVWHCHIVDHEDNEMMRPYFIGNPATDGADYQAHSLANGEMLFP